jgi:hypothetical protein
VLDEHSFNNSAPILKLREEAKTLVTKIQDQSKEIDRLKHFRDAFEKQKKQTQIETKNLSDLLNISKNEIEGYKKHRIDNLSQLQLLQQQITGILNRPVQATASKGEDAVMKTDSNAELLSILKELKAGSSVETEKEELRKKYENYKKLFLGEKLEKDSKINELKILKEETAAQGAVPEIKELRIKYENLKLAHQKEYNTRKEKEQKLEEAHNEI